MIYAYKCRSCGRRWDDLRRLDYLGCECGEQAGRDFSSVQMGTVSAFQPHFNHAVGAWVNTSREFDTLLKVRAEENSQRTGITHSYTRIDPGDMPRPTKDDYIFETQEKAWRDNALPVGSPAPVPVDEAS